MTRRGKYTLCALVLAALAALALFCYGKRPKSYPMTDTNIRGLDAAALTETIAKDKKLSDASQLSPFPEAEKYSITQSSSWHEPDSLYHLQDFLEALQYMPQEEIHALQPDADHYRVQLTQEGTPEDSDRSITYSPDGAAEIDGWYIHLTLYPMHANEESSGYSGSPEEAIELFYGR